MGSWPSSAPNCNKIALIISQKLGFLSCSIWTVLPATESLSSSLLPFASSWRNIARISIVVFVCQNEKERERDVLDQIQVRWGYPLSNRKELSVQSRAVLQIPIFVVRASLSPLASSSCLQHHPYSHFHTFLLLFLSEAGKYTNIKAGFGMCWIWRIERRSVLVLGLSARTSEGTRCGDSEGKLYAGNGYMLHADLSVQDCLPLAAESLEAGTSADDHRAREARWWFQIAKALFVSPA